MCGTGPEVGEAIVTHPLVDMVSLTGSVRAGRRVMELAAAGIKRVHLELGGKSANIILEDADLERAIDVGIDDAFRNAGQVCGGLTRILAPRGRLRAAEELAVSKAESYVIGDPFDPATTLGPVTTAGQRERVRGYIRNGIADGGRLLTGGPEAPTGLERGWFVRPIAPASPARRSSARWWSSFRLRTRRMRSPSRTIRPTASLAESGARMRSMRARWQADCGSGACGSTARHSTSGRRMAASSCPASGANGAATASRNS
jgi:hypothetical protein